MTSDSIRDAFEHAREPDPRDGLKLPILALGHRAGSCYFLTGAGEVSELKPRDFTLNALTLLFGGDAAWLVEHFPEETARGKKTGRIDLGVLTTTLIRRCVEAGLWRLDTPKRSVGVWRHEKSIIAHCGDALFFYAGQPHAVGPARRRRERAGQYLGDALYLGAPPIEAPSDTEATAGQALELLTALETGWRFGGEHLPRMVFGFMALGLLGAAPQWRVHLLLTGIAGQAGKTTLLKLIRAALGPQANYVNDPTEAGLREALSDEARTIVYDEAGDERENERASRVEMIIGLLRRMAGDEGARSVRGTGSGARIFTMAGSAVLAAVAAPMLDAQDRSRILEIDMLPVEASTLGNAEQAILRAGVLSAGLRARALRGWGRFQENLTVYRAGLIAAGCDGRQADQLGTMFAAAEMLGSDAPAASADADVTAFAGAICRHLDEAAELSNAQRCYGALMSTQIEHWKGGAKSTLGRLLQLARDDNRYDERNALKCYGLRLEADADARPVLWVANTHRALDKVFAGTDWRGGRWRGALKQLPGAAASPAPAWFDGHQSRFVIVPHVFLPPAAQEIPRAPP